jgi:CheY-like chemotaxis protein
MEIEPIDLIPVITAAIDGVRPAALAKQIEVVTHLDAEAARVLGDGVRLQQVVWNVTMNAVKFTPKSGQITIELKCTGPTVELSVSDTGQGIAREFLPHVFERFRQWEQGTTRLHGGLGLGLALVRHLVEAHGGHVRAASPGIGKGSQFVITLPAHAVCPAAPEYSGTAGMEALAPPRIDVDLSNVTVLVLDDEVDARELISAVLEMHGAKVWTASNASEALRLVQRHQPSVVVSDIGMPETDGYEFVRQLRAEVGRSPPALALSGFARGQDRVHALKSGFQQYASKPIDPAHLVRLVATLASKNPTP